MTTWRNQFIRVNQYSRPGTKLKEVRKIIVHWTANFGASAANHFTYFDKSIIEARRYASAHLFIDKSEAICIVPLDEVTYAANDGSYRGVPELLPNANTLSVSVEMCVEKDGTIHADTIKRTEDVVKEICEKFSLNPIEDVVRHYDVTHKNCPAPWISNGQEFVDFKRRVKTKMEAVKLANEKKVVTSFPKAREWAMVNGISDGNNPKDSITRDQAWEMLRRLDEKWEAKFNERK